jgi:hypothetical protein
MGALGPQYVETVVNVVLEYAELVPPWLPPEQTERTSTSYVV